jgi:hypothetical protein
VTEDLPHGGGFLIPSPSQGGSIGGCSSLRWAALPAPPVRRCGSRKTSHMRNIVTPVYTVASSASVFLPSSLASLAMRPGSRGRILAHALLSPLWLKHNQRRPGHFLLPSSSPFPHPRFSRALMMCVQGRTRNRSATLRIYKNVSSVGGSLRRSFHSQEGVFMQSFLYCIFWHGCITAPHEAKYVLCPLGIPRRAQSTLAHGARIRTVRG